VTVTNTLAYYGRESHNIFTAHAHNNKVHMLN